MENKTYLLLGLGVVGALFLLKKKRVSSSAPSSNNGGNDLLPQEIADQPESFASLYTVSDFTDCYAVKYVDGLYGLYRKSHGFYETAMTAEELEAQFSQPISLAYAAVPYSVSFGTLPNLPDVAVNLEISVVPVTFTQDNTTLFAVKFTLSAQGNPDEIRYIVRLPSSVTILTLAPDDLGAEGISLQEA